MWLVRLGQVESEAVTQMSVQLPKLALPCLRATCHLVMAAPPFPPEVQDRARPPSLAVWLRPVGAAGVVMLVAATLNRPLRDSVDKSQVLLPIFDAYSSPIDQPLFPGVSLLEYAPFHCRLGRGSQRCSAR